MKNHILEARNKLGGKEIPEMITKIEEKSQKDRVLTASKTIWIDISSSVRVLAEYGYLTTEAQPTRTGLIPNYYK